MWFSVYRYFISLDKFISDISFFGCSCVCVCLLSCVLFFATSWTVACQAPLSMELSRPEYWSGLPFPTTGDLSDLGIKSVSHASSALVDSLPLRPLGSPRCYCKWHYFLNCFTACSSLVYCQHETDLVCSFCTLHLWSVQTEIRSF